MQNLAYENSIELRPHIKTHKTPGIALWQLEKGAKGIAVATLQEAEVMVNAGVRDVQVANEMVSQPQLDRFLSLHRKIKVTCAVDSYLGVDRMNELFKEHGQKANVLVDINTGLDRTGLLPDKEAVQFCQYMYDLSNVHFEGIMTHAGHAYGAKTQGEVARIGETEGEEMTRLARELTQAGIPPKVVSAGSTPTARYTSRSSGITELRVGNYVFHDLTQVALGTVDEEKCALSVLATVLSVPVSGRAVMDAGSKALTVDQGAHGKAKVKGFGKIMGKDAEITRLSEEHGVIEFDPGRSSFQVGEQLRIIPNHACPVMNLFDKAYLVDETGNFRKLKILARGHG